MQAPKQRQADAAARLKSNRQKFETCEQVSTDSKVRVAKQQQIHTPYITLAYDVDDTTTMIH